MERACLGAVFFCDDPVTFVTRGARRSAQAPGKLEIHPGARNLVIAAALSASVRRASSRTRLRIVFCEGGASPGPRAKHAMPKLR